MPEKIILSTVSAWELGEKFNDTQSQKNEALREAKFAKLDGDLSENAPYQAAKEKFRTMGRIQRRLTKEMNDLIAQGHILVDPLEWATEQEVHVASIGTVTSVKLAGVREDFLIAGARDHRIPEQGDLTPLPYTSPLGRALDGHRPGDRFTAKLNGETRDLEILSIRRPTREEIRTIFPGLSEDHFTP